MSLQRITMFDFWCKVIAFLHLLILIPSSALNTDGIFLLSFKYSVLSDPLSVLGNWSYDDDTPCSWTGVNCTELGNAGTPDMLRVTSLILPNSQLVGMISPEIGSIQHLQHLDLSNNFFNGLFPLSLINASELQILNLSDNALTGTVPESLSTIANLTVISLKGNNFWGDVPSGFKSVQILDLSTNLLNGTMNFDGSNLRLLNFSHNNFSGKIPLDFANTIPVNATIDISFNNLTGAIPQTVAFLNQKIESFSGNLDLCGKPLMKLCSVPSTFSTPPNITTSSITSTPAIAAIPRTFDSNPEPTSSNSETLTGTNHQTRNGLKATTIAAIIVGDLAGIGIFVIVGLYIYQIKKRNRNSINSPTKKTIENAYINGPRKPDSPEFMKLPSWSCLTVNTEGDETSTGTSSPSDNEFLHENNDLKKRGSIVIVDGGSNIELESLLKASAYVLGTSGTSIVYKAVLEDGSAFAVRRIGEGCVEKLNDFEKNLRIIAKLRHPNLVKIKGFCWGPEEKLVIYDYANNGSLASAGKTGSSPYHLPLKSRLTIAKGVARGLTYIHGQKHVHGNLKPSNILLNSDMDALISDLGLNRLLRNGLVGQGPTSPYNASESYKNDKGSAKMDVYSFGIVLLELLTGKVYMDWELTQSDDGWLFEDKKRVLKMAEVAIRAEVEAREDDVLACFKLGFSCASLVPHKRPSMKEALEILEKISLP